MIKPTIGRVVWFWPEGKKSDDDQPMSAQIAFVHGDRMVNLGYFDHNGVAYAATSVTLVQEGDESPGQYYCEWMPYQMGQAKKYEGEKK